MALVEHTQVPVRYDPFDIGTAYAFVQGRWIQCISEYHIQLKGHSERELLVASAELRRRRQNHAKTVSITGNHLAEFLASAEAHKVLLAQRLQDVEAQDVFAQMGGMQANQAREKVLDKQTPPSIAQPEQKQLAAVEDVYADPEIYEERR